MPISGGPVRSKTIRYDAEEEPLHETEWTLEDEKLEIEKKQKKRGWKRLFR